MKTMIILLALVSLMLTNPMMPESSAGEPGQKRLKALVFGGNQRGPLVWRTEHGSRTYRDWQEDKLKQAGVKLAGS